jgi:hypothetical protein
MNPYFEVKREKLVTESGLMTNKEALINSESDAILGIVSPGYEVVTHEQVAGLFSDALETYKHDVIGNYLDSTGRRWKQRIVFKDDRLNFDIDGRGDFAGIMLELFNGYDARTAFGYNLLGFRYACTNGMVTGKTSLFRESLSHFNDAIDRLQRAFELKWPAFESRVGIWQDWTRIPYTEDQFKLYLESKIKNGNKKGLISEKMAEGIVAEWTPSLNTQNLDETMWGAFNVLTYLATHKTKARNGSNLFSNRYNTMNRLAEEFYNEEMPASEMVVTV